LLITLTLGILATVPAFAASDDLLEAEMAFQPTARFKDAHTLEVRFQIAEGYYLYRHRFGFATESGEWKLGRPAIPAGKAKQDATFGKVQAYRQSVRILLPVSLKNKGAATAASSEIRLGINFQGCADIGVCYPPQRQQFILKADSREWASPGTATPKPATSAGSLSDLLKKAPSSRSP
jgi:thiol:disulfide interchange protein DsbD